MADREPLTERQVSVVREARSKAFTLYEGAEVAHRSCGIALAETFDLPTRAEIAQLTTEALILFAPEDAPELEISPIAGQTRPEPQETPP